MAKYTSDEAQSRSNEHKTFLRELIHSVGTTQEYVAYCIDQQQAVVSAYQNPMSERNFPASQIEALPYEMATAYHQFIGRRIVKKQCENLNGSVVDEIVGIVGWLAKIDELDKNGGTLADFTIAIQKIRELEERIMAEKQPK